MRLRLYRVLSQGKEKLKKGLSKLQVYSLQKHLKNVILLWGDANNGLPLIARIKWKGKPCAPWRLLYPCWRLWVAALCTLAAKAVSFCPLPLKAFAEMGCSTWGASAGHAGRRLMPRDWESQAKGAQLCPCSRIRSYRQLIFSGDWWIWWTANFWKETKSCLRIQVKFNEQNWQEKKGGNVELLQCFETNVNTSHFSVLSEKTRWTSALFQNCPKLNKKEGRVRSQIGRKVFHLSSN